MPDVVLEARDTVVPPPLPPPALRSEQGPEKYVNMGLRDLTVLWSQSQVTGENQRKSEMRPGWSAGPGLEGHYKLCSGFQLDLY